MEVIQIRETYWLEDFAETCRDIQEDAILLEALSMYVENSGETDCLPQVFRRLCGYLSQHISDLLCLEKRLGPDPTMESGP